MVGWAKAGAEVPLLDVTVEGYRTMCLWYTWIGVSPDDRYVVFPVSERESGDAALLIWDTSDGSVRTVPDAWGPVGFTADGTTIVSYRYLDQTYTPREDGARHHEAGPSLLLVDTETLSQHIVSLDQETGPRFFVTSEGNYVVVADSFGDESLVLYDVDNDTLTDLGGPDLGLNEFVSRPGAAELWLVQDSLYRVDLLDPVLERVSTTFKPEHINILAERDLLVLDHRYDTDLRFYDPDAREVVNRVTLGTTRAPIRTPSLWEEAVALHH